VGRNEGTELNPIHDDQRLEAEVHQKVGLTLMGSTDSAEIEDQLVIDDVLKTPPAAQPRMRHGNAGRRQFIAKLVAFDVDRRGNARVSGLGEQGDNISVQKADSG
jgi:hypothetical protein